jgi:hypothetical protein
MRHRSLCNRFSIQGFYLYLHRERETSLVYERCCTKSIHIQYI